MTLFIDTINDIKEKKLKRLNKLAKTENFLRSRDVEILGFLLNA